ncbi:MAG: hypothetical protein KGH65_02245 [Candidatus Micrarchaeota archaeon]|nr:hypothetical protein [Candidatus Micrarchaeota archaeon]
MSESYSDVKKLNRIKSRLEALYPIKKLNEKLTRTVREFEKFVFVRHKHEDCDLADLIPKSELDFFRRFFAGYETLLEQEKAKDLIEHRCTAKHCLYKDRVLSRTFSYAESEGKMAGIKKTSKVLVVGSGPFPETAIGYALAFGCEIICLEKRGPFVKRSRKVVEKLGLGKNISIVHGTTTKLKDLKFDKVLVTALAVPKSEILGDLRKSNCDIILRTSFGSSKLVYSPVDADDLKDFEVKAKFVRLGKNFTSSILVRKKGRN